MPAAQFCFLCEGECSWGGYVMGHPVCRRCALNKPHLMAEVQAKSNKLATAGHGACRICGRPRGPICARCRSQLAATGMSFVSPSPSMMFATGGIIRGAFSGTLLSSGASSPFDDGPPESADPRSLEQVDKDRAPDLIEPVLAWRGWNVTPDGHLVAAATDGIWDRGPNHAVCRSGTAHTDVPAVTCDCGFYGWHETKNIAHGRIWGGIRCWGEIIVHDCGVRAEWAEIVVLIEKEPMEAELLARVVDRYQVPVVKTLAEAEKVAASKGILVPAEMRPEPPGAFEQTAAALAAASRAGVSMTSLAANMQAAVTAVNRTGQQFAAAKGAISAALVPPKKPEPSGPARFRLSLGIATLLVGANAMLLAYAPMPSWEGIVAGFLIGIVAWFSPAPAVLWRFGRAVRCFWHGCHEGHWYGPPEGVARSQIGGGGWSRTLRYHERCAYCWRKRRLS